ncbi:nickel ABC transporter permease subunit NikB, partial [Klebsiella michiganensis]|nr:nickel ABC transporter permease subunit NikB [Klebsiella michiganensis]
MLRYAMRRVALLIPMIFAASVIIFLMLRLGTGDPALDYLRLSNLPPTPEMVASTRAMLGLERARNDQHGSSRRRAVA